MKRETGQYERENDLEEKLLPRSQENSEGNYIVEVDSKRQASPLNFKFFTLIKNNSGVEFVDIRNALNQCVRQKQISFLVKDAWLRNKELLSLHLSSKEFVEYIGKTQQFFLATKIDNKEIANYKKAIDKDRREGMDSYNDLLWAQCILVALLGSSGGVMISDGNENFLNTSNHTAKTFVIISIILSCTIILQLCCVPCCFSMKELSQEEIIDIIYGKTLDIYCKELYKTICEGPLPKIILREESRLPEELLDIIEAYRSGSISPSIS